MVGICWDVVCGVCLIWLLFFCVYWCWVIGCVLLLLGVRIFLIWVGVNEWFVGC